MRNLKRALSLALAAIMVLGMMVVGASAASYDDFSNKDEIVNTEAVSILTALNVINGESELADIDDIAKAYQVFSPNAEWNGSNYTNADTGVKLDNVFLVYQDTYIMGDPGWFMGSTEVEVPEKYFTTK